MCAGKLIAPGIMLYKGEGGERIGMVKDVKPRHTFPYLVLFSLSPRNQHAAHQQSAVPFCYSCNLGPFAASSQLLVGLVVEAAALYGRAEMGRLRANLAS